MWYVSLILLFLSLQSFERYEVPANKLIVAKSLEIAHKQVGTIEEGKNNGDVKKYWSSFSKSPIPYCAAGQYWTYAEACRELNIKLGYIPFPKSALALNYFNYGKSVGVKTEYVPKIHDFIIWQKGKTIQGHIERIINVNGNNVRTIGFNTGSGDARDGDGVYYRNRNIKHIIGRLRVRGLIGFKLV